MRRGTLLILILVVGLLVVVMRKRDDEIASLERVPEALFPSLATDSAHRIGVENLTSGRRVTVETDADGRWSVTAPVVYPASSGMLSAILSALRDARAVPEEVSEDLAAYGLEPPRAVITFESRLGKGRLELGGDEVAGSRLYARAVRPGGEVAGVYRIAKTLWNAAGAPPDEYRERRATWLSARDVVSFRRRGTVTRTAGGEAEDLTLDLLLDPQRGWVSQEPRVLCDPVLVGLLVRAGADLRVDRFESDDPGDFQRWGLDAPAVTVELEDGPGQVAKLLLNRDEHGPADPGAARWWATRAGYPHVWGVEGRSVGLLVSPREELYDALLVRAGREEIRSVTLGRLRVERGAEGWTVREADEEPLRADEELVSELLARLEFARVESWAPLDAADMTVAEHRLAVELRDGRVLGGVVAARADGGGTFHRTGDEVTGTLGPEAMSLFEVEAAELRARRVQLALELYLAAVRVEGDGGASRFVRDRDSGLWTSDATSAEAGAGFYATLERALLLRALAWVDADEAPEAFADAVTLVLEPVANAPAGAAETQRLTLGRGGDGRTLARLPDGAVLVIEPELHASARALLPRAAAGEE